MEPLDPALINQAIQAADVGILITDHKQEDNPIVYVNPYFYKYSGYSESDVLGKNCRFLQGEGTDPAAVAKIKSAIKNKKPAKTRIMNYCKDGTIFWQTLSINPIFNDKNELTHYVGIQEDVTKQVAGEKKTDLEIGELREDVSNLSVYAKTVAHDLKGPLQLLMGYSDVLSSKIGESNNLIKKYIARIRKTTFMLNEMIEGLLIHSISEEPNKTSECNLDKIVRDVRYIINKEDSILIPTVLPKINASKHDVREIIFNLIWNSFSHGASNVVISHERVGTENTRLIISDNGPGVATELNKKLKTTQLTTNDSSLSGHGFSIINSLIDRTGAQLHFDKSPMGGVSALINFHYLDN